MRGLIVSLFIVCTLFLMACEEPSDEEVFYEMQRNLNSIKNYSCVVDMEVKGNKSPKAYRLHQVYRSPNQYRMEYIEPKESEGYIILYDGQQSWIYHPKIEQSFRLKEKGEALPDKTMFLGYFLEAFATSEEVTLASEILNGVDYLIIETELPGHEKYRRSQRLWINRETFKPYKQLTYDGEGEVTVKVLYQEFEYNIDVEEGLFQMQD